MTLDLGALEKATFAACLTDDSECECKREGNIPDAYKKCVARKAEAEAAIVAYLSAAPEPTEEQCPHCKGTGERHVCGMVCVDIPCDCRAALSAASKVKP